MSLNRNAANETEGTDPRPLILAITGASGTIYALRFMELMKTLGQPVELIISDAGQEVAIHELGDAGMEKLKTLARCQYSPAETGAPPASGSGRWQAMVILPCTMGTLGAIANGISANLVHRAADCFLKERRPLVLAPRETPLNRVHLKNLLAAHDAGATICPAMPSFYHKPASINDMAGYFAARIAELLGFHVETMPVWKGIQDR